MKLFNYDTVTKFELPGVVSHQLIGESNAPDANYNFTDVTVQPDAIQPRHTHEASEQTWYCISGHGVLLLKDNTEKDFKAGDVARFEKGDVHGMHNRSDQPVRYVSVTNPRTDFSGNYDKVISGKK